MKLPRDAGIERILTRQAQLWESERVVQTPPDAPLRPNVALSQQPFAGGEELAARLAERLGWELYDRRLVDALHEDDILGKSVLESLDEHLLSFREDWIFHLFVPGHMPNAGYVRRLSELVFSIAMRGHAVFVGRGAGFIVPPRHRLAVLACRGFETRLRTYAQQRGKPLDAARRDLVRLDRERGDFIARSFHRHADDPAAHDLCLNLDTLGLDEAASIVVQALAARFPQLRHLAA